MRSYARSLMLVVALLASACGNGNPAGPDPDDVTTLEKIDLILGTGAEAGNTSRITVHYTGYIYEAELADHRGAQFETTRGGSPISFLLSGDLIAGWKQGIPTMRVGGQRRLIIPARLAYGDRGQGSIPPNSAIVFDIELLAVG